MMYAGSALAALALVAVSVVALPNHLKAVVVDKDPAAEGPSVAASFGPYSAKAGLGGSASASGGGGGLYAAADSPHGSASAGLGGGSGGGGGGGGGGAFGAEASAPPAAGGPHKPKPVHHGGPTFFDDIFNIPISVLQSVNTYLNNRGPVTKPVHRRRGHPPVYKTVTPEHSAPATAPAEQAPGSTPGSAPASAPEAAPAPGTGPGYASVHQPAVVHKRVDYDAIFNIPISALKSVNHLLNGNGKK